MNPQAYKKNFPNINPRITIKDLHSTHKYSILLEIHKKQLILSFLKLKYYFKNKNLKRRQKLLVDI